MEEDELLPRAFAVAGEIDPETSGPPTSGEDYLKRVRWEYRRCPAVVVSDIDPRKYDNKQTQFASLPPPLPAAPPGIAPSREWETKFLAEFAEMKQTLRYMATQPLPQLSITLPHPNDGRGWFLLCFGANERRQKPSNDHEQNKNSQMDIDTAHQQTDYSTASSSVSASTASNMPSTITSIGTHALPPLLSIVLHLDDVTVQALLHHHIQWFETRPMTAQRAQWFYALLARLEKPLDPDTAASLRTLLRRSAVLRSKMTDPRDPLLPALNIIITIVAKYFNQQEPE
jgi:survival of motor neuron protein-interacting protein 1